MPASERFVPGFRPLCVATNAVSRAGIARRRAKYIPSCRGRQLTDAMLQDVIKQRRIHNGRLARQTTAPH